MEQSNQDSEIDLGAVFRGIGNWFKGIFNSLIYGIALLRETFIKKWWLFCLIILIAVTRVFYISSSKSGDRYTSSMILKCDYLTIKDINASMEKLNRLCSEPQREGLMELLSIDASTAKNIIEFEALEYVTEKDRIETELLLDQLNNVMAGKEKKLPEGIFEKIKIGILQTFQIKININDPDVVKRLDSALVNYFIRSSFISKRINAHRKGLIERRDKLQRDSKKLDSLKEVFYQNFSNRARQTKADLSNVILSDKYLFDPVSLYKEALLIDEELKDVNEELLLKSDFEVIDGLTTYRTPSSFDFTTRIILGVLGSVVIGYLLIGLFNLNKYLASLTKNQKIQSS